MDSREACSNLGQGFDVLFSRLTGELDLEMIDYAGKLLEKKGIDKLPIGVTKTDRGMTTFSGGW